MYMEKHDLVVQLQLANEKLEETLKSLDQAIIYLEAIDESGNPSIAKQAINELRRSS